MGAARKLQSEIDRCLKKVQEGIDEFDQIWQKVHDTENANQKEKFEADLKKEIKKLQRLRDQIKSWISGADIKDKSALLEARKSIEREMERFKSCEKEAKMKQFSKAALGQADKLDPREQAKAESRDWINDMVDRLNVKIEQYEYEMEELSAGLKKKAKPPQKLVQLEEVVTVHKKHASALEKALRCLENDAITAEEVDPLRDDLDYYLNMDLDEHYDNTDDMYCEIADRLEAVEAAAPAAPSIGTLGTHLAVKGKDGKVKGSGGGSKEDEEREKEKERERERAAAAAVKAQLIAQGNSNVKLLEEDDRAKGAAAAAAAASPLALSRPPAIATTAAAGGSIAGAAGGGVPPPPLSPLSTPAAVLAGSGGSGGMLLPSPPPPPPQQQLRSQGSLRTEDGSVPASPAHLARVPSAGGSAAAGSPADTAAALAAAAAAAQNGLASVMSPVAATPPPTPPPAAAAGPAAAPAAPAQAAAAAPGAAAGAAAAGRQQQQGVTLAALIGNTAAARDQQQQQKQAEQQQAAAAAAAAAAAQQQQQQQQQPAASPADAAAAAAAGAAAAAAGTPSGGRLGAWMAGVPESAKAAAGGGTAPAAAAAATGQAAAAAALTAAAVLAKGIGGSGQKPPPAAAGQQQQQQLLSPAGKPDASNGPLPSPRAALPPPAAAGEVAAAAAVRPALPDGASGANVLEVWSRAAAADLGLGGSMHGQVPRSFTALQVLEGCMRSALPQPSDSDWNRPKPRHPIVGPASYPKTQPDVISAPGLFRKMDPEALFFAFYYQPDTYQQYLAAQELKRQSWRYHKHHNAWFQRYAEPSVTSDEFEQGTYVYFDYNIMHDDLQTGWCYRRKENFTFRYDALEDELPVQQV